MATTQYVRPPRQRKPVRGKAKPETEWQQFRKFMYRHRDNLAPLGAAVVVVLVALIAAPVPLAWLWLTGAGLGGAALAYLSPWADRSKPKAYGIVAAIKAPALTRKGRAPIAWEEKERAYAAAVCLLAGGWAAWFTTGGIRPLAAYPFVVVIASMPWWTHRRTRHTVPVTIAKELSGQLRKRTEIRARQIIDGWDVLCRQGKIGGAKLLGLEFDAYAMAVDVELKGGQSRSTLNYKGYANALESAFAAPDGSFRPLPYPGDASGGRDKNARMVRLRFLLIDPNAAGLGRPTDRPEDPDWVGRFETRELVVHTAGVHTGVFGATNAGKSGLMNTLVRRYRMKRNVCMIGIDMKPGAPEFSPWGNAWFFLADTRDKAEFAFTALLHGLERRGKQMRERGWRKWKCTPAEPGIAVFIDEVQQLNKHKLMGYLEDLAGIARAYGFELIIATQHPKDGNLSVTIYNALGQIYGLKVTPKADRVVFGETANQDGWMPSRLMDDGGRFLVRSKRYRQPMPARGFWMEDEDVAEENATGPGPVMLDDVAGELFYSSGAVTRPGEDPVTVEVTVNREEDVVDADVVSDSPRDRVLEAIRSGVGFPSEITKATGIPLRTVNHYINGKDNSNSLAALGLIWQEGTRKPWRSLD